LNSVTGVATSSTAPSAPPIEGEQHERTTERPAAPVTRRRPAIAVATVPGKQRNRRGDVRCERIETRIEQRRKGDEAAAAGQRILGAGDERRDDQHDVSRRHREKW
jgi:DNA-binding helix-hairpin-helix protein with protein kinase domain